MSDKTNEARADELIERSCRAIEVNLRAIRKWLKDGKPDRHRCAVLEDVCHISSFAGKIGANIRFAARKSEPAVTSVALDEKLSRLGEILNARTESCTGPDETVIGLSNEQREYLSRSSGRTAWWPTDDVHDQAGAAVTKSWIGSYSPGAVKRFKSFYMGMPSTPDYTDVECAVEKLSKLEERRNALLYACTHGMGTIVADGRVVGVYKAFELMPRVTTDIESWFG